MVTSAWVIITIACVVIVGWCLVAIFGDKAGDKFLPWAIICCCVLEVFMVLVVCSLDDNSEVAIVETGSAVMFPATPD